MKKYILLLLVAMGASIGSWAAQSVMSDTLLFVFKLHGQTRKYQMVFHEQQDTLYLNWKILRNLRWQSGSYITTPAGREQGSGLCFLQPEDGVNRLLPSKETAYILSRKTYKELKQQGMFHFNQTMYVLGDKGGEALGFPLLHCVDQNEGGEIWVLDNEELPIVWRMQNNPLNINWQVEHSSVLYSKPIEIISHRGANHLAPENTWVAALKALEQGATWIELDVRQSKDGVLYNLHDETLDRTTNGKGAISEMPAKDIERLDAGSWFGKEYAGIHVPQIAEMLDSLYGKASVFFDVKRGTSVPDLVALVRLKGFAKNSFFWFADENMLIEFGKLAPDMKVKVNASDVAGLEKWMSVCHPAYVEVAPQNITPGLKAFCNKHHIRIIAAIQNENEDSYRLALEKAPDMVNLDRPDLFRKVILSQKH